MKSFYHNYLAVALMAAGLVSTPIKAYENAYQDCCRPSCCYECSCNPLYCGAWDLQIQAGIEPTTWSDRGNFSVIQCTSVPASNPITALFEIPQFHRFYKLPWTVGFQIGYHHSDNVRLYFEFDYMQASHKHDLDITTLVPSTYIFNLHKYKLYEAYVGARYYWDRWCDRVSFFLGAKVGLVHHKRVRYNATVTTPPSTALVQFAFDAPLFGSKTRPSGGVDFGFDVCFCGCWSLVVTGAVLASCGPDTRNLNLVTSAGCTVTTVVPGINNILIGHLGTELRFPVTAGVRYSF